MRAMELFWEHGYSAASLTQLTACMGINRQSLYDTYGDKRGLFLKALDRYSGLIGGRLLASLSTEAPWLNEIKATIAALIGFLVEFPKPRACLMANTAMEIARHDQTVADKVQAFHRTLEDAFEVALRNARHRREIASTADLPALAKYLVSVANGMAATAKAGATKQNLRDIAGVALTALQPTPTHSAARKQP